MAQAFVGCPFPDLGARGRGLVLLNVKARLRLGADLGVTHQELPGMNRYSRRGLRLGRSWWMGSAMACSLSAPERTWRHCG